MRKISKSILAVSLLSPFSVYALGIGEITTHSALNQVLRAEIPLVGSQSEDPSNIRVGLASAEAFARAGLDRPFFLSTLKFSAVTESNGSITVHVSSEDRIKEPFVNFLLEVEWPKGTTMREFTILLDPPSTMETTTAPLQTIPVAKAQPVEAPAKGASASYQTTAPTQTVAQAMPDSYGPVKKNDNLWNIAGRLIENGNITREQMMLALYDQNPKAFYKNNVNALKRGAILSIPEQDVILSRSATQARSEFNQHNELWSAANRPAKSSTAVAAEETAVKSTPSEPSADTSAESEAQLKLLTPTETDMQQAEVPVQGGSVDTPTGSDDPSTQANIAMEMATTLEQENAEFRDRLDDLESQVEKLQKLIALKDEQLAQLQSSTPESKPEPEPAQAPVKPTPEPDSQPFDMAELGMYGGGALLLAALVGLLGRRRKSKDSQELPPARTSSTTDREVDTPAVERNPVEQSEPIEVEESTLLSEFTASEFDDLSDHQPADPMTETDVYIAYGRYQQAEDLMLDALQDEPDNKSYQLKLLDIYFAAGKASEFEDYAQSVRSLEQSDPDLWMQIETMGSELCPQSELFGDEDASEIKTESDDIETFDLVEPENPDVAEFESTIETIKQAPAEDESSDLEEIVTTESEPEDIEALDIEEHEKPEVIEFEPASEATEEAASAKPEEKAEQKDDFEFDFDLIQPTETDQGASEEDIEGEEDEATTKLALAEAYLEMEDLESARETLNDVIAVGDEEQKAKARELLDSLES